MSQNGPDEDIVFTMYAMQIRTSWHSQKMDDYMGTLLCDGAEKSLWDDTESKLTQLKMINNQDIDLYTSYPVGVVKLKKGEFVR